MERTGERKFSTQAGEHDSVDVYTCSDLACGSEDWG